MMSACILWPGYISSKGYGMKWSRGKMRPAHRVTWENAYGIIPDGLVVMHKCDNRACVNLEHLRVGTSSDNHQDCIAKGRNGFRDQRAGRAETSGKILPKGICYDMNRKNFTCSIRANGKRYHSRVPTLEDAILWRIRMEKEYWK